MSVKTMLKRKFMDFAKDESGMGTVEVVLIMTCGHFQRSGKGNCREGLRNNYKAAGYDYRRLMTGSRSGKLPVPGEGAAGKAGNTAGRPART